MRVLTDNIEEVEAERLRKWLSQPAADIFVRVVESEAFVHECKAAEHLLANTTGGVSMAQADVDNAIKTRYILELFKRLRKQEKFSVAKSEPSVIPAK